MFGFDTIVISGAEQTLETLWNSSKAFHGFVVVASALWGTVIGALGGGWISNLLGRKQTLLLIGAFYLISALGSALVSDPYSFACFRFLGGLGVGASTIAAPAYLSEISPARLRGRLVAMYQLSIVLGVLIAYLSNYCFKDFGENAWRWMIGIEAIPAAIYAVMIAQVPKSPRWLSMKGDQEAAAKVMKMLNPGGDPDYFPAEISEQSAGGGSIFSPLFRRALWLAFFIALFNQLSGINAFLYFGPRIFEVAGLGSDAAFLSSVGVGVVNLSFTLLGMALIDRLGRKQLMYIGSVGYIVSLVLMALAFIWGWQGIAVPIFLFLFIASHAVGQGTVIWVFISELFPTQLRAPGQAFGSSVHWVMAAVLLSVFPQLADAAGPGAVFSFFAVMMVGQLIWVFWKMPETKGESLEEVSAKLQQ